MKNLQEYITRYRQVANKLGYVGDSVEILIQLLAQASYISEVENITYMTEASLDKAALMNSKIQHCVDVMYSVFRGACPRVVMKIKPTKYLDLKPYDTIVTSNNFTIQYLAYGKPDFDANSSEDKLVWSYDATILTPALSDDDYWYILGFVAPKRIGETLTLDDGDVVISTKNTYYVECTANDLSDDMYVEIVQNNGDTTRIPRTRVFAEHILEHKVYDLTLPGYGSRLYIANYYTDEDETRDSRTVVEMPKNTIIRAQYYGYSELSDYNLAELKRVQVKGAELLEFGEEAMEWLGYEDSSWNKGLYYVEATSRDDLNTIHYKANRERYTSSIMRSNSDIGTVLEETYPSVVMSGGTSYYFTGVTGNNSVSNLMIYYIPKTEGEELSKAQIEEFISNKSAYYITNSLSINKGSRYTATFTVGIEAYSNSSDDWSTEIGTNILINKFNRQFNVDFSDLKEVESLIAKNSNIKKVLSLEVKVTDDGGREVDWTTLDKTSTYYDVKCSITSSVKS